MIPRSFPAADLRRALIVRGWTAADLAREAHLNADTITSALDDSRSLTLRTENRIIQALGRHPADPSAVAGLQELAS